MPDLSPALVPAQESKRWSFGRLLLLPVIQKGLFLGRKKSRKIRHANTGLPSKTVSAADVREEALHTAANGDADKLGQGDGDEHGAADADLDESFEEEPEVREVAISDICNKQWSKSVTLTIV